MAVKEITQRQLLSGLKRMLKTHGIAYVEMTRDVIEDGADESGIIYHRPGPPTMNIQFYKKQVVRKKRRLKKKK